MGWVKTLKEVGHKATAEAPRPKLRASLPVHEILLQVRPSQGNDPGEIAAAFYTLADNVLTITDENGTPKGKDSTATLRDGDDAEAIARAMAASLAKSQRSDFNRRLNYAAGGWT